MPSSRRRLHLHGAAPGDRDDPGAGAHRDCGHADRPLAAQALLVQRALADDDQIGAGHRPREAAQVQEVVDARPDLARPAARPRRIRDRPRHRLPGSARRSRRGRGGHQVRPVREGTVEQRDASPPPPPSAARRRPPLRTGRSAGCPRRRPPRTSSPPAGSPGRRAPAGRRRADSRRPPRRTGPVDPDSRAPRAATIPAPPSVVALPPMPSTMWRAPRSSASRISSPTPNVDAVACGVVVGRPGREEGEAGRRRHLDDGDVSRAVHSAPGPARRWGRARNR